MSCLQIKQLTVRFGGLCAVNKVDFAVERGQIFSVIGPNGAGKTTVFNAVTGVYQPTEGDVLLGGRAARRTLDGKAVGGFVLAGCFTAIGALLLLNAEPLWMKVITGNFHYHEAFPWGKAAGDFFRYFTALSAHRLVLTLLVGAGVGVAGSFAVWHRSRRTPEFVTKHGVVRTFQNIRLFQQMTVLENVLVGMDTKLRSRFWDAALRLPTFWKEKTDSESRALGQLRFVGLENEAHLPAASLAYGHQRRLEIARALASEPDIILLDEPAAGMNPQEVGGMMDLICRIRERGVTVLLIEHHMQCVMGISDRIAVLDHGEKIAEGTPRQVQNDPAVITAYLGEDHVAT